MTASMLVRKPLGIYTVFVLHADIKLCRRVGLSEGGGVLNFGPLLPLWWAERDIWCYPENGPTYLPSCCASAAVVPLDLSLLSSEKLGNPCACFSEFVTSGVLQEIPSFIHALLCQRFSLSLFSSPTSSLVWGLCWVSEKAVIISLLLLAGDGC